MYIFVRHSLFNINHLKDKVELFRVIDCFVSSFIHHPEVKSRNVYISMMRHFLFCVAMCNIQIINSNVSWFSTKTLL
jgi:hypothetical protein